MRNLVFTSLMLLLLSGCQTLPIVDVRPGEKPPTESDIGGLWYIAEKVEKQIINSPNRIRDKEAADYLTNLMCDIALEYCSDIRVYIVDYPYFNAFMMPNGAMVVWTGLLLRAESESQVAFVLAHELGHFVKQHGIQSFRQQKNAENLLLVLTVVSPTAALLGSISTTGSLLKYSRDFEREADEYSIQALKNVDMDPSSGAELFTLVQEENLASKIKRPSLFFSTHPPTEERIATIEKSKTLHDNRSPEGDTKFRAIKSKYLGQWLPKELSKRSYSSSEVLLNRLLSHSDDQSVVNYYLGELYRKRGDQDDYQKSVAHYKSHITSNNLIDDAHKKIASMYARIGNADDAIKNYQTYLSANPLANDSSRIEQIIKNLRGRSD